MNNWFEAIREDITKDGLIYQKTASVAETLVEIGHTYPFMDSVVTLDSITADNSRAMVKEMLRIGKRLSAKLSNKVEPESPNFVMHYEYKVNGMGGGEAIRYIPFTLTLHDGQVLTALVRNTTNKKKYTPKDPMIVAKWALNKQDITSAIYFKGDNSIDLATTTARLKKIIEKSHIKFVKANPHAIRFKGAQKLADEIDNMDIDYENVVWSGDGAEATDTQDASGASFANDEEKMADFKELSREEFLKSYSYLTEQDYDATVTDTQPDNDPQSGKEEIDNPEKYQIIKDIVAETDYMSTNAHGDSDTAKNESGNKIIVSDDLSITLYFKEEVVNTFKNKEEFLEFIDKKEYDSDPQVDEFAQIVVSHFVKAGYKEYDEDDTVLLEKDGYQIFIKKDFSRIRYGSHVKNTTIDGKKGRGFVSYNPRARNNVAQTISWIEETLKLPDLTSTNDPQPNNEWIVGEEVTAINGKTYTYVGDDENRGEILEKNGKYYYFSTKAGRMMPVAKKDIDLSGDGGEAISENLESKIAKQIEQLKAAYDSTVWAIDDYKTMKKKEAKNKQIIEKLKELGVEEGDLPTQSHPFGSDKNIAAEYKDSQERQVKKDAKLKAQIKENDIYQKILKDGHGGVMYNAADGNKYDVSELMSLWNQVSEIGKKNVDGIMKGVFSFIKESYDKSYAEKIKAMEERKGQSIEEMIGVYDFSKFDTIDNSEEFEKELDALADQIEADGKMDDYEDKLSSLADKLTELMKKENEVTQDSISFRNIKLPKSLIPRMTADDHNFEVFDDRIEYMDKKVAKYSKRSGAVSFIGKKNKKHPLIRWMLDNSVFDNETAIELENEDA